MSARAPDAARGALEQAPRPGTPEAPHRFAVVGNPNTGKTTLFNQLCGVRARTANFPGVTIEARIGARVVAGSRWEFVDLPGHYGLNLDRPESRLCRDYIAGALREVPRPHAVLIVADATNLARNLIFVSQALQQGLPAVVALNMIDLAQRRGLTVDAHALSEYLGCPVVPVCARSGAGIDDLLRALAAPTRTSASLPDPTVAQGAAEWAEGVLAASAGGDHAVGRAFDTLTDRLDAAFTHPLLGILAFAAVMSGLFYAIFALAAVPMDLIDLLFAHLGALAGRVLPAGPIHDLVADGIIGGVAGTVVFLPQICLLFFLISLLEDTGYLARAAFVMDRLLRRFGLPGQAFVPLLSAHACAIPAIMSSRLIPDHRDRLATILVAPFLSCSARLPVYVLLIGILFGERPLLAGLAFTGCYALGAAAALLSALVARRTILRGASRPMVLELPTYKLPSLRTALLTTYDRASVFLRKAGTVIVAICIVLWWLGSYPHSDPPRQAADLRAAAAERTPLDAEGAAALEARALAVERRHAKAQTFMGRVGRTAEPLLAPIGADWQLSIGVLSSFMAREVFVSTMSVVLSGEEEDEADAVRARIAAARRDDGAPLFTTASAASLLVFYVLAMQCLPTLAVTRRETGSWRWALLQLGYMTGVAYVAALATRWLLLAWGIS
jgi:ferrous iron transport protein B